MKTKSNIFRTVRIYSDIHVISSVSKFQPIDFYLKIRNSNMTIFARFQTNLLFRRFEPVEISGCLKKCSDLLGVIFYHLIQQRVYFFSIITLVISLTAGPILRLKLKIVRFLITLIVCDISQFPGNYRSIYCVEIT